MKIMTAIGLLLNAMFAVRQNERTRGRKLGRLMSEHTEQAALIEWATMNLGQYPELVMLYAIPNGGKRHIKTAAKLKAEGVKAGVWDLSLDVARDHWHGLKIEMKWDRNDLTYEQSLWAARYQAYGYQTVVAWQWTRAAAAILDYLAYDVPGGLQ